MVTSEQNHSAQQCGCRAIHGRQGGEDELRPCCGEALPAVTSAADIARGIRTRDVPHDRRVHTSETAWTGRVALIAKPGGPNTGVGRYVHMLHEGLRELGIDAVRVAPSVPPLPQTGYSLLKRLRLDARTFLNNYPVWAEYPRADVYHLTSQNLATLLLFRRPPGRVVVTVHDIIPYMLRNDPKLCTYRSAADRLFDRLAMAGLKRADGLIADSEYTRRCVVEHLRITPEKIDVIYLGIDHQRFRPLPVPLSIRERYDLPQQRRYLIYVGSEDPRKNLETLVRALAAVRRTLPDVELIKVGRAHFEDERRRLRELAANLGVLDAIHFLDDVPDDDLPLLYNLADVCVMPSLYEGFGFPVLEAMACGTPVVCANASSLPELVGDAGGGMLYNPNDFQAMCLSLEEVLAERAKAQPQEQFSWQRAHELMQQCYRSFDIANLFHS
jgi:glycosyltransferase involved in cell wall biosynthesis